MKLYHNSDVPPEIILKNGLTKGRLGTGSTYKRRHPELLPKNSVFLSKGPNVGYEDADYLYSVDVTGLELLPDFPSLEEPQWGSYSGGTIKNGYIYYYDWQLKDLKVLSQKIENGSWSSHFKYRIPLDKISGEDTLLLTKTCVIEGPIEANRVNLVKSRISESARGDKMRSAEISAQDVAIWINDGDQYRVERLKGTRFWKIRDLEHFKRDMQSLSDTQLIDFYMKLTKEQDDKLSLEKDRKLIKWYDHTAFGAEPDDVYPKEDTGSDYYVLNTSIQMPDDNTVGVILKMSHSESQSPIEIKAYRSNDELMRAWNKITGEHETNMNLRKEIRKTIKEQSEGPGFTRDDIIYFLDRIDACSKSIRNNLPLRSSSYVTGTSFYVKDLKRAWALLLRISENFDR